MLTFPVDVVCFYTSLILNSVYEDRSGRLEGNKAESAQRSESVPQLSPLVEG